MIGRWARRREGHMRQEILRGVYEENLRIVGRTSARQAVRARASRVLRAAAFLGALVWGVLFTGSSYSPQFFPEQQIQARFLTLGPSAPARVPEPTLDPALFRGERGLPLSRMLGLGVRSILIDPGHGGEDAGAIGHGGTREKDVTLDIARRLKRRLEAGGRAEVRLTRDGDQTLPLGERVAIAHEGRADLFLSVHLNFLPAKPINIVETYYFGPARDAKAADLARRENAGAERGMSDFRAIVERLGRELKLEESRAFAAAVQSNLLRSGRRQDAAVQDHGIKRAPFVVLLGVEVPAALAEVSCLSNTEEEARLAGAEHREEIAASLEAGILDYLRTRETTHESRK